MLLLFSAPSASPREPLLRTPRVRRSIPPVREGRQGALPILEPRPSRMSDFGRARQAEIFTRGLAGRRPAVPVDPKRLEQRARRAMSRQAWAYEIGRAHV